MGDFLTAYAQVQPEKLAVVDDRPDGTVLISFLFAIALVALLLHPMSREYQRIWFR